MRPPKVETGAGEDKASRRWRVTVTVGAWLLIVQAGSGVLFGLASLALIPQTLGAVGQLRDSGGMLPGADLSGLDQLEAMAGQLGLLTAAGIAFSAVLLAGSVGLLRRRKWGWYTVTIWHVISAGATMFLAPGLLRPALGLFDPARADLSAWLISALLALAPASVVAVLVLGPVVRQFEPPPSVDTNPAGS